MGASHVIFRDLAIGDAGWLIERHATRYAADEGFDASFESVVARILADFIDTRGPRDRAWIAVEDGDDLRNPPRRLGSIFCVQGPDADTAKLRLFYLEPWARRRGVGRALLDLCIQHARMSGYRHLTLWTHESHRAACALYEKAGFACVSSKPVHSFGVDLVEQEWTLDLRA